MPSPAIGMGPPPAKPNPPRDGDGGGPPDPLWARAERLLRPQLVAGDRSGPATAVSFAEVMGPAWRHLSDAEIYQISTVASIRGSERAAA